MCHIATLAQLSYDFGVPGFNEGFQIKHDLKTES